MTNLQLKIFAPGDFLTLTEASEWAAEHLGKKVSDSNISYLINYGRIQKYGKNGDAFISKNELIEYYKSFNGRREHSFKNKLGNDLKTYYKLNNAKQMIERFK